MYQACVVLLFTSSALAFPLTEGRQHGVNSTRGQAPTEINPPSFTTIRTVTNKQEPTHSSAHLLTTRSAVSAKSGNTPSQDPNRDLPVGSADDPRQGPRWSPGDIGTVVFGCVATVLGTLALWSTIWLGHRGSEVVRSKSMTLTQCPLTIS